ncbi:uncharacterized protein VTP21DRAFT_8251 [Calcarisporiella thermophila]|uniref:uncharacterized protein n=1 Tax=Calcarisporiella thermophila TaxID=911321 RepID=UPI0037441580
MTSLKRADRTRTEDPSEIARIAARFYTELYTGNQTSTTDQYILLNYVDKTLSADDRGKLEEPISEKENKSPCPDGLTAEFYQAFDGEFAPTLQRLFNEALTTDNPMDFSKKATIILNYKRKGDAESLSNWRPISLLNVDIKLLTRILVCRIQRTIMSIIYLDQCGFALGCQAQENALVIHQTIEYAAKENCKGTFLFLDQEKAYDRVSWHWLERYLEKFNFGSRFRSFIQRLHNGYQASVSISGSLTVPFPITRGIRQGDPLSPYLYNITVEPILVAIRSKIWCIAIPRLPQSITTLTYADDLTVGVADQQDVTNLSAH